jgi:hypothetical protein
MSSLAASPAAQRARAWIWWLLPAVVLGALIGWEIDWGRQVLLAPATPAPIVTKAVEALVLPEYRIEGGITARGETVSRTLFNPTRRPAQVLADGGGLRRIQSGQYQLVGTSVTGDRNVAFLKPVAGGAQRMVRQGDEFNGMRVAIITPDRVRLMAGDDIEDLVLKVAPGPKATLTAAPAAVVNAGQGVPSAAPAAQGAQAPAQPAAAAAAAADAARRVNRRAPSPPPQAGGAAPSNAVPSNFGPPPPNAPVPGTWDAVYENMRRQNQQ